MHASLVVCATTRPLHELNSIARSTHCHYGVVYATTRLEFGRDDARVAWRVKDITRASPRRWAEWVANLRRIASRPGNTVAANNWFDVHYIRYHTGVNATYIPSWCGGIASHQFYSPERGRPFLLGPYRDNLARGETDASAWSHPILASLRKVRHISATSRLHLGRISVVPG